MVQIWLLFHKPTALWYILWLHLRFSSKLFMCVCLGFFFYMSACACLWTFIEDHYCKKEEKTLIFKGLSNFRVKSFCVLVTNLTKCCISSWLLRLFCLSSCLGSLPFSGNLLGFHVLCKCTILRCFTSVYFQISNLVDDFACTLIYIYIETLYLFT